MIKNLLLSIAGFFAFGNLFSQWVQVGQGANGNVNDLIVYNNTLVAGGLFNNIGNGLAKWSGNSWSAFGQGVDSAGFVYCLDTMNGNLYAGGDFSMMDGVPANNIAIWNGSSWSALGGGTNGAVTCMVFFAGELYIGGQFTMAGSVTANNVAKWDGTNWSALGSGLMISVYSYVHTLCVYNNELYAGGYFSSPINNIAKWDGTSWLALGSGVNNMVASLKVYNNELYVGGHFHYVNNMPMKFIAKWNGAWSPVASNPDLVVRTMSVLNGNLFLAGSGPIDTSFAMWDGQTWTLMYTGIISPQCAPIAHGIYAIEKFGNDIYLGGDFHQACSEPGDCIVYANQSVGVEEPGEKSPMEIYPNPSSGQFTIRFPATTFSLEITDATGRIVYRKENCSSQHDADLTLLADGMYFARVFDDQSSVTEKLIIKK